MSTAPNRVAAENRDTLRGFIAGAFLTSVGWFALLVLVGGNP